MPSDDEQRLADPTSGDGPIYRRTIRDMSEDELLQFIKHKRERIQSMTQIARKAREQVYRIKSDVAKKRYEKQIQLLEKDIDAVSKKLDRMEARIVDIRANALILFGTDLEDNQG